MEYNRNDLATRIKKRRKELRMTTIDVAEKIGINAHYYGTIERGDCGLSVDTLISIAVVLDLSVDYILFGTLAPTPTENNPVVTISRLISTCSREMQNNVVKLVRCYVQLERRSSK